MKQMTPTDYKRATMIIDNENDGEEAYITFRVSRVPALQFPDKNIVCAYTLRGVGHFDDAPCERCGDGLCCCDRCDSDHDDEEDIQGIQKDPLKPALLILVKRVPELRDLAPRHGTFSTVVAHQLPRQPYSTPKAPSSYDIKHAKEFRYCSYATTMAYLKVEFMRGYEQYNFTFAFTMMDYDSWFLF